MTLLLLLLLLELHLALLHFLQHLLRGFYALLLVRRVLLLVGLGRGRLDGIIIVGCVVIVVGVSFRFSNGFRLCCRLLLNSIRLA